MFVKPLVRTAKLDPVCEPRYGALSMEFAENKAQDRSAALRAYEMAAYSVWIHILVFCALVARVSAPLGRLPVYGEPHGPVHWSLQLHFIATFLTAVPFWIPPLWILPLAALAYVRTPRNERWRFLLHTGIFLVGYALVLANEVADPWGLVDWFMD